MDVVTETATTRSQKRKWQRQTKGHETTRTILGTRMNTVRKQSENLAKETKNMESSEQLSTGSRM